MPDTLMTFALICLLLAVISIPLVSKYGEKLPHVVAILIPMAPLIAGCYLLGHALD